MTKIGIVIGTGPSLSADADLIRELKASGKAMLFGMNRVHLDFNLDVWIACDPAYHAFYGQTTIAADCWHWDKDICSRYGYRYIEGRWHDGLSPVGSDWIAFNHGSGPQALNLATSIYQCDKVLLVGHDMTYKRGELRHYFRGVSEVDGEYPAPLRKFSRFEKPKREGGAHPDGDGILYNYKHIAEQDGLPPIINCTPGSAMTWFPMSTLQAEV